MIIFTWTLTPNQIRVLKIVARYHDAYEQIAKDKDKEALAELQMGSADVSHWISAARVLIREGFIRHIEVDLMKWEKGVKSHQASGKRQAWEITDKGRLMLQLVAIELEEQRGQMELDQKELKLLSA